MNKKILKIAITSIVGIVVIAIGVVYVNNKGLFNNVSGQPAAAVLNCIVAGPGCPGWTGTSTAIGADKTNPAYSYAYNAYGCRSEKGYSPIMIKTTGTTDVSAFPAGKHEGLSSIQFSNTFNKGIEISVDNGTGPKFDYKSAGKCENLTSYNDKGSTITYKTNPYCSGPSVTGVYRVLGTPTPKITSWYVNGGPCYMFKDSCMASLLNADQNRKKGIYKVSVTADGNNLSCDSYTIK